MGYYNSTLQKGSQGDEVKKWQEFLNTQGYGLSVDGDFGTNTYNATVAYQKANGLGADGIVGKNTWGKAGFKLSPSSKDFAYDNFSYDDFTYDDFTYDDYKESDAVKNAGAALDSHNANKPAEYQSKWQSNIDALMDKILNREEFSYDLNADALYNQYKDQYMQQGKIAMEDTMGQVAAMTGGYGNSYAATVGNQAYQAYLGKLNEVVPELYQMALDRYTREGENLYNQYGMLSDRENLDYGRYRDTLSDYLAERDYLAGRYDSERDYDYSKYNNERGFAYDKYSSDRNLAYDEYSNDKNLAYQEYRNAIADEQWEKQFDENKRRYEESKVASSNDNISVQVPDSIRNKLDSMTSNTEVEAYLENLEATGAISHDTALQLMAEYMDNDEVYKENDDGSKSISYSGMIGSTKGWSVIDKGGANFVGIDENAKVQTPNGETITLNNLKKKLMAEGMSSSEARNAIKKLQQNLGISSNWFFGL